MSEETARSTNDPAQKLHQFVAAEMRAGGDRPSIVQKLTAMGVEPTTAEQVVGTAYVQISAQVRRQQFTPSSLVPAIFGAAVAAVVGGGVWGALTIYTNYEVGYVAWGLGVLSGFSVVWLSGGRKGPPLQIIAVVSSILAILIGKYLVFYSAIHDIATREAGADKAAALSAFSTEIMRLFVERVSSLLTPYDALWVILALGSAWRIPKGSGIKLGPANPYRAE